MLALQRRPLSTIPVSYPRLQTDPHRCWAPARRRKSIPTIVVLENFSRPPQAFRPSLLTLDVDPTLFDWFTLCLVRLWKMSWHTMPASIWALRAGEIRFLTHAVYDHVHMVDFHILKSQRGIPWTDIAADFNTVWSAAHSLFVHRQNLRELRDRVGDFT